MSIEMYYWEVPFEVSRKRWVVSDVNGVVLSEDYGHTSQTDFDEAEVISTSETLDTFHVVVDYKA